MNTAFAYAQARLQARHGQAPGDADWRRLVSTRELGHLLQTARGSGLRPWVLGLGPQTDSHEVEILLRSHFRAHTDEVAAWLPAPWQPATRWVGSLPELPLLHHLLTDPPPPWFTLDPSLQPLLQPTRGGRLEALGRSPWAPLVDALLAGASLRGAWLRHWRGLWPRTDRRTRETLDTLTSRLERHLTRMANPRADGPAAREALRKELRALFRHYAGLPAAAYAHLALFALDLERLRAEIMDRALFPPPREEAP